jgi:hypothetical protein
MATVDILSLIELGELSDEQKVHLRQKLQKRKQDLAKKIKAVNRGLTMLGKKSKRKSRAKGRKYRRAGTR